MRACVRVGVHQFFIAFIAEFYVYKSSLYYLLLNIVTLTAGDGGFKQQLPQSLLTEVFENNISSHTYAYKNEWGSGVPPSDLHDEEI